MALTLRTPRVSALPDASGAVRRVSLAEIATTCRQTPSAERAFWPGMQAGPALRPKLTR